MFQVNSSPVLNLRFAAVLSGQQDRFENKILPSLFFLFAWSYAAVTIVCALAGPVSQFDDALPLVHGMLVQQGRTPNLDFYSFYPPLSPYVNAAAFDLFGRTVIGVRLINAFLYVLVLLLATLFFQLQFRRSPLLTSVAVSVMATAIGAAIALPVWPGFAISLIALLIWLCSHHLSKYRLAAVIASGALTGLTILYRINFGGYVAAIVALDILLHWLAHGRRFGAGLRTMAAYAIPLTVVLAGVCLWIYGESVRAAVSEFVVTAQKVMSLRGFIHLQFTEDVAYAVTLPPAWFFFRILKGSDGLPLNAVLAGAVAPLLLGITLAGRAHSKVALIVVLLEIGSVLLLHRFAYRLQPAELTILLFYCCLLHYFLSRADWFHWRLLPIAGTLLLPFLSVSVTKDGPAPSRSPGASIGRGAVLAVLLMVCFSFIADTGMRPPVLYLRNGLALLSALARHPRMSDADLVLSGDSLPRPWASIYPDKDELQALRYVRARTGSSDPIFVGLQDHSTLFWSNLRMYWLAGRPIGVRHFQLETRVATEAPVQQEIISDLKKNNVSWIILDCELERGDPTFAQTTYKGSSLLDEYITAHFREEARFGRYAILRRH